MKYPIKILIALVSVLATVGTAYASTTISTNISTQGSLTAATTTVSNLTVGSLSGFLEAASGAVSTALVNLASDVTGILGISNGGTGTSTAPSYGQLLMGNDSGGYNLVSTSSLGISGGSASPGGASSTIQFNCNGSLCGDSNLEWNGSYLSSPNITNLEDADNAIVKGASSLTTVAPTSGNFTTTGTTSQIAGDGVYYYAFPNMVRTSSGELIVTYKKGTGNEGDTNGAVYFKTSKDQGETWSSEGLVYSDPSYTNTGTGGMTLLKDGTVLATANAFDGSLNGKDMALIRGTVTATGSVEWGNAQLLSQLFSYTNAIAGDPLQMLNGDILLPVYGKDSSGSNREDGVLISHDDGYTWGSFIAIGSSGSIDFSEMSCAQLSTGRVVCLLRVSGGTSSYYMSYSDDNGTTWSAPTASLDSGYGGHPTIIRVANDGLLYVGRSVGGVGTTGWSTSWDGGLTWTPLSYLDPTFQEKMDKYDAPVLASGDDVQVAVSFDNNGGNYAWIDFMELHAGKGVFSDGSATLGNLTAASIMSSSTLTVGLNSLNYMSLQPQGVINVVNNQSSPSPNTISINTSGSNNAMNISVPNLSNGNYSYVTFGKNFQSSTGGAFYLVYHPNSNASANYAEMYAYGNPGQLSLVQSGNVGIGTTTPGAALTVAKGDIFIATSSAAATGIILEASDGSCHRLTIDSSNNISASTVTCP